MTDVLERSVTRLEPPLSRETPGQSAPLYDTVSALLKHVRIMVLVPGVICLLAVMSARSRREYMAQSRITPQSQDDGMSSLMGMAAQLGMGAPASGRQNESVDFYADLIRSREVLESLAVTPFTFAAGPDSPDTLSGTYIEVNKIKGKTDFDRRLRARRRLEGKVTVTVKRVSGLVTVQVRSKWGHLSEQMNRRLLDLVNIFNLQRRQTAARAEREFLNQRLVDVGTELKDAQASVRSFLDRNRAYQDDPSLSMEMQNRNRKVEEAQRAYADLVQRHEVARAEEVRNTPVITIVEAPEGSRRRTSGWLTAGLLGLIAGGLLAAGIALGLEYAAAERIRNPEAYSAFRRLWEGLPRRFFRGGRA